MAINSLDLNSDNHTPNSSKTGGGNLTSCRLVKINFATEGSICSATSRRGRNKSSDSKSPYLNDDNIFSQVSEKTFIHKKGAEIFSSFPLAVNIYKANSDDFKVFKKTTKKAKKSVLTLPNDPAPLPQTCTVSDMNDSEYFNQDENIKKLKKRSVPRSRKIKPKSKEYQFYDRDAQYCSQMNLDCSSSDIIQNRKGNERNKAYAKSVYGSKQQIEEKSDPHDVWAVLRNINRFQFRPSPPMSEDSFITPKMKKGSKRRNNRKDMRIVETCRTEEFAYISSYEVDNRSPHSFSKSSSFDRITVIDKQDDFSKIYSEFEKMLISKDDGKGATNKHRVQNGKQNTRSVVKRNTKNLTHKANIPKANELILNKQCNEKYKDTLLPKRNKLQGNGDNHKCYKIQLDNPVCCEKTIDNQEATNENYEEGMATNEFIYSADSELNKTIPISKVANNPVKRRQEKPAYNESNQQLNGITKVVLRKGSLPVSPMKIEHPKRTRQAMISSANQPVVQKPTKNLLISKLTQADIKRRLTKLKFPIVILNNDQLSSSYEVITQEHPQFNGLNDHVWPFMLDWDKKHVDRRNKLKKENNEDSKKKKNGSELMKLNMTRKTNRELTNPKLLSTDKSTVIESRNNKIGLQQKRFTPELIDESKSKPKSIRQFKDKMLKLLYKKSTQSFVRENSEPGGNNTSIYNKSVNRTTKNKIDASTNTPHKTHINNIPRNVTKYTLNPFTIQVPATKQPRAKANWASDFIDNVIRKIKNGVYYTHDSKLPKNFKQSIELKEAEIQTVPDNDASQPAQPISKLIITKKPDLMIDIPGFNTKTQPVLEIKTMNTNEITVKHLLKNIVIHFDIGVQNENMLNLKRSSSLISLDVTESLTKVFKCKTSIMNAMLPAELCSLLPKMMWNIVESGKAVAVPVVPIDKGSTHLSTIKEISRCESPEPYYTGILSDVRKTNKLQRYINGLFRRNVFPKCEVLTKLEVQYDRRMVEELLPRLSRCQLYDWISEAPSSLNNSVVHYPVVKESTNPINICTDLQSYPASDRRLIPAYKRFNVSGFLQCISNVVTKINPQCSPILNLLFKKNITIKLSTANSQGLQDSICININSLMMDTSYEKSSMISSNTNKQCLPTIMKCVSYTNTSSKNIPKHIKPSANKTKKKAFVKLYQKCKSTSNISGQKTSIALSKITNVDEFFEALGTSKLLSAVFDNQYRHKILSSLNEMKNWIKFINVSQALLVLLLVNKKDTPNLMRFRPVLLQGIAVHRITRANELDMEIEVIEREHLNRLHQHEGISYVASSVENRDNLLEELCWIAKTTASDYQRTFDESSEKLLKSLLAKRKKLNPSYLRVMARYVGLGLLKSPVKK